MTNTIQLSSQELRTLRAATMPTLSSVEQALSASERDILKKSRLSKAVEAKTVVLKKLMTHVLAEEQRDIVIEHLLFALRHGSIDPDHVTWKSGSVPGDSLVYNCARILQSLGGAHRCMVFLIHSSVGFPAAWRFKQALDDMKGWHNAFMGVDAGEPCSKLMLHLECMCSREELEKLHRLAIPESAVERGIFALIQAYTARKLRSQRASAIKDINTAPTVVVDSGAWNTGD